MPRKSEGLSADVRVRATPDEAQMARDIASQLGMSQNRAMRWVIRYAWQHATATTDHSTCPPSSPCAGATRGLTPGRQRPTAAVIEGQTTITHTANVE